jgi:hypothetical protein
LPILSSHAKPCNGLVFLLLATIGQNGMLTRTDTFKIQSHAMFLDTSHNSLTTVLTNIHSAFLETATKTYVYTRLLPSGKKPGFELLKRKYLSLF